MIAVAALVGVTALAVKVVSADAHGCGSGVRLPVAAAPEITPAVQEAARRWMETNPEVNGECVKVQVNAVAPADLASALAVRVGGSIDVAAQATPAPKPTPRDADWPAVWIPDSTAWLGRVAAIDRNAVTSGAPSVAMSPVVFGMPEGVAATLAGGAGAAPSSLLQTALVDAQKAIQERRAPQFPMGIVDPRRDSASLAAAMVVRDAVVTDESKLPGLIAVYRVINRGHVPDVDSLSAAFTQGIRIAPMSEQAVAAANTRTPTAPVAAVPFAAGGPSLDYPYATLAGKPRDVELAATRFRGALLGGAYRDPLTRAGFRAPDGTSGPGFPTGHGITPAQASANALGDPQRVAQTLGLWSAANSPSRALTLVDVSSSMASPVPGQPGTTRLALLQRAAAAGLQLFTDTSSLGLWTFASGHGEVSPIIPLTAANRQVIGQKIAGIQATGSAESALFVTLREAYRTMIDGYAPGVVNRIIVFTDGRSSISEIKDLEQLNRQLETLAAVTKPIEVTLIGVGADIDMAELEQIAQMTDGIATRIRDAGDIETVFLRALLA